MSYLLVAHYQNNGHEEKVFMIKEQAIEDYEEVKKHPGAFSATLYKLVTKKAWVRGSQQ